MVPYLGMAPLVIAEQEGFFRDQWLQIEQVTLRRSGEAVAALARGQVDVVAGAVNLVLLNAIEKGANIRIVADKGHYTDSSCVVSALLVHRESLRDGTLQSLASLRGKKVDLRENSILSYAYDSLLRREHLGLGDVEMVSLPRGGQLAALENRAVAALSAADPWLTQFKDAGPVVVWHSINEAVERLQYSVITYGPSFLGESTDTGYRFMTAYLMGVRQYNQGKTERNLAILAKETGLSKSVLSRCCWPDINPEGTIILDGLHEFQEWAVNRGELAQVIPIEQIWEPRFAKAAAKTLSSVPPRQANND